MCPLAVITSFLTLVMLCCGITNRDSALTVHSVLHRTAGFTLYAGDILLLLLLLVLECCISAASGISGLLCSLLLQISPTELACLPCLQLLHAAPTTTQPAMHAHARVFVSNMCVRVLPKSVVHYTHD